MVARLRGGHKFSRSVPGELRARLVETALPGYISATSAGRTN